MTDIDTLRGCAAYLKEGETLAECIQRNRDDANSTLRMLADERRKCEKLRAENEKLQNELAALSQDDGKVERALIRSQEENERIRALIAEEADRHSSECGCDWCELINDCRRTAAGDGQG